MGQDPEVIRREIEETRERMGDTVDAIGYKADVKERTRDYVGEKKDAVTGKASSAVGKVTEAADSLVSKVTGAAPSMPSTNGVRETAGQATQRGKGIAYENPLGLAVAGAAVGFLIGLVLPSTSVEDEKIGPMAQEVKDRAVETGQEALERGKEVASDVASTATEAAKSAAQEVAETARQRGQEQGQELAESARSQAQDVAGTAREQSPIGGSGTPREQSPLGGPSIGGTAI